ncbi:hypothetical protein BU26DRAFT_522316 [Trematosphaeria pertusa]|uniref:Uncharacterized protein n=1 Tax=Trematosphaeria pertusa TaxID=390896 RepID=A0A6A6I4I3_9PLEO|nr:uncharacterized protein BU26DRAFT_522316 [Trematosphaeria pertusa]KAF2245217.1 hypothetical protein BU26DRAFT_522316 [Trematosphaeria pertusa]
MASITSLSVEGIQKKFSEDGVFYVEDPAMGDRVEEIRSRGFPIESVDGLDFCRDNVLNDMAGRNIYLIFFQLVRCVLEALFPWSGLGIYEVYRTDSNYIYAFMTGMNSELKAIVIQL